MNRLHIHKHRGFTLLEVLIALLVLSIGLLGLAALQTSGLRSNQMATMRTLATQIAYDMTDRMRANPTGVNNSEYVITTAQAPAATTATGTALDDLTEWRAQVARLPGGLSSITRSAGPPVTHEITVYWDEERKGAVLGGCPPADNTELRCLRLTM